MIDNVQNNPILPAPGMNTRPQPDRTNPPAADGSDATLQVHFGDLIRQALQTPTTETDAVQKARELLQSGRLTSPENIRQAAESIVTLGF